MPHDQGVNEPPGLASGGGGLYSTAADYLRFAQMLANRRAARRQALARAEHGRADDGQSRARGGEESERQVRHRPLPHAAGLRLRFRRGDLSKSRWTVGSPHGKGTYLWDGLAGTWFWIDPTNDVVFLGIIQRRGWPPGVPNIEDLSRQLTFQALVEPPK